MKKLLIALSLVSSIALASTQTIENNSAYAINITCDNDGSSTKQVLQPSAHLSCSGDSVAYWIINNPTTNSNNLNITCTSVLGGSYNLTLPNNGTYIWCGTSPTDPDSGTPSSYVAVAVTN